MFRNERPEKIELTKKKRIIFSLVIQQKKDRATATKMRMKKGETKKTH
jgi:hypothetical protein